jgi:hypothetical protein
MTIMRTTCIQWAASRRRLALILGLAILNAACSGSPVNPSDVGIQSSERRVQTGGSGGTFCLQVAACSRFQGRLEIIAGGGTLTGTTSGAQRDAETSFEFTAELSGTGRFTDGFIDAIYDRESATVRTIWFRGQGEQYFQATNESGTPTYTELTEKGSPEAGCVSGRFLESRLTVILENLGPTEIIERHCIPEP